MKKKLHVRQISVKIMVYALRMLQSVWATLVYALMATADKLVTLKVIQISWTK